MPPRSKGKTIEWIACQHCNDLYTSKDIKFHADICVQNNSVDLRESFPECPSIFRRADADGLTATKRVFLTPVECCIVDTSIVAENSRPCCFLHPSTISSCCYEQAKYVVVNGSYVFELIGLRDIALSSVGFVCKKRIETTNGLCCLTPLKAQNIASIQSLNISVKCNVDVTTLDAKSIRNAFVQKYKQRIFTKTQKLPLKVSGTLLHVSIVSADNQDVNSAASLESVGGTLKIVSDETIVEVRLGDVTVSVSHFDAVVGGFDKLQKRLKEIWGVCKETKMQKTRRFMSPQCVLLHGLSGTGKTLIAKTMMKFATNCRYLSSSDLWALVSKDDNLDLGNWFNFNKDEPSITVLDDCDCVWSRKEKSNDGRRLLAAILTQLDEIHEGCLVIATCTKNSEVDSQLKKRFDCEIELAVPTTHDRTEILKLKLRDLEHALTADDFDDVSRRTQGFVGGDLVRLIKEACVHAHARKSLLSLEDFVAALHLVKPSAIRELAITVPDVRWDDVGGLDSLKLKLRQTVEWPLKHTAAFRRLGLLPSRGLLMYGPPGCSKTLVARALARESGLSFISIKGPELFSKWVGESERAVRELFQKARAAAPVIIFFDEIDALAPERSSVSTSGGSEVGERVLAQILTEIDGVESLHDVTIIAATNRPDKIDRALLRPGRLDRLVYVPLPDCETRRKILQVHLRNTPVSGDVKLDDVVDQTVGYSGAEISAVCHEAAFCALERDMEACDVTETDFKLALDKVKPRTSQESIDFYKTFAHNFEQLFI